MKVKVKLVEIDRNEAALLDEMHRRTYDFFWRPLHQMEVLDNHWEGNE